MLAKGSAPKRGKSIDAQIRQEIWDFSPGSVFVPASFLKFGSRDAVDKVLSRLSAQGTVRRLSRGLYDTPRSHPRLGVLSPSVDEIAKALAGRDAIRLQPAGAYAANILRLSEQVPAKAEFLTDGPSRKVKVGNQEVILKQVAPRRMGTRKTSGLVIEALRYVGQANVSKARVKHLRTLLKQEDRHELIEDLRLAPAWMHPYLRYIAGHELKQ